MISGSLSSFGVFELGTTISLSLLLDGSRQIPERYWISSRMIRQFLWGRSSESRVHESVPAALLHPVTLSDASKYV